MHKCTCKDEMEAKVFRRKIEEKVGEPVFRLNALKVMLAELGCDILETGISNALKSAKIHFQDFGLVPRWAAGNILLFRASDVWQYFLRLDKRKKIFLFDNGLKSPADLVNLEIKASVKVNNRKCYDQDTKKEDIELPDHWQE